MTEKEVYRCYIIKQVYDKSISQVKAAEILKISDDDKSYVQKTV